MLWPVRGPGIFDHGADAAAQFIEVEGLAEDFHAGRQPALADDGVAGVAGDEQDGQCGQHFARGIGELAAIEAAGQADIGHQQVQPPAGRVEQPQGLRPVAGLQDLVAEFAQRFSGEGADHRLVVDEQEPGGAAGGRRHGAGGGGGS
jgi:hypothetical protein